MFSFSLCSVWQCGSLSISQEERQSDIQLISGALGSVYTCCVCHGSVCHTVNLWHWKDWRLQESNLPTRYTLDPMKGQAFLKPPQIMTRTLTRALTYPARYCGSISKRLTSVSQCRNIDIISASETQGRDIFAITPMPSITVTVASFLKKICTINKRTFFELHGWFIPDEVKGSKAPMGLNTHSFFSFHKNINSNYINKHAFSIS